jgi:hypothetical protein
MDAFQTTYLFFIICAFVLVWYSPVLQYGIVGWMSLPVGLSRYVVLSCSSVAVIRFLESVTHKNVNHILQRYDT